MARLADIVLDCRHPASLARFWAAALDGYAVAPYDEAELERLRAKGINDPEDDPTVLVEPPDRSAPRLWLVAVPEPRTVKNRMHLDLRVPGTPVTRHAPGEGSAPDDGGAHAAEVARLVGLGATVLAELPGWVVLADPEGNEFCLLR